MIVCAVAFAVSHQIFRDEYTGSVCHRVVAQIYERYDFVQISCATNPSAWSCLDELDAVCRSLSVVKLCDVVGAPNYAAIS